MRKDISDRIDALRRRAAAGVTKTQALEKLLLAGLKEEARVAKELRDED